MKKITVKLDERTIVVDPSISFEDYIFNYSHNYTGMKAAHKMAFIKRDYNKIQEIANGKM